MSGDLNWDGSSDSPTTSGIIDSPHERPQELDAPREKFTKISEYDEKHWYSEYRVDDCDGSACGRARRNMAIS